MREFLLIFQIIISCLLILFILLQQRGTALGSAFGGGSEGFWATKRGLEKKIFWATVVLSTLFVIFSILNLLF
ncbi:MAG: preprotein translocase subunit SecG [Patescibacteria group bacterium]|nr:preprotein translocase subunit SecG [Patescibacteria group bacterium]